jgi:hypothetical protein
MYAILWKGTVNSPWNYEFMLQWKFAVSLLQNHLWKNVRRYNLIWFISKCQYLRLHDVKWCYDEWIMNGLNVKGSGKAWVDLWFLAHMFFYQVNQRRTLSVVDYIDFVRRTRWKTYQVFEQDKICGKLSIFYRTMWLPDQLLTRLSAWSISYQPMWLPDPYLTRLCDCLINF